MQLVLPGGGGLFSLEDLFSDGSYLDSSNVAYPNATEEQLIEALAALERGDIEFVIVQDDRTPRFIQTSGGPAEGYYLQYSEGQDDSMFEVQGTLSGADVTAALAAFLNRDPAWRTMHEWRPVKY